ncbi:TIGR02391 family protein [Pseudomonas sp. RIT778]|uniref:TIGR02391 family protein n=1 Tax=Pseudomonas sp. RIT778 TaxID=2870471 RepID=UPI001C883227|nr:TIGR02391 family protein [Pseudomonas sp. RIT778]MBX8471144.1 TIGR02391 family protein [Pseudomonas sp. RIT778]
MNLETKIPTDLWTLTRTNYEKRNFTGAILDAFHYLSDLIRKKSGLEGDGAPLIGSAFGGASPKIKLNKLQTESERNIQKGMEQTLRGIYQTFRNPRSHEKISDTDEDAQIIIIFIGYIVRQLDLAKSQFSREDYLKRILDPDFVPQVRYAELLVDEIPANQRLETFLDVYRAKTAGKIEHLKYFFNALIPKLSSDQINQAYEIISDELKTADDETTLRIIIGSLGGKCWAHLQETARLRIENRLIRSIKDGKYDTNLNRVRDGSLGTWIVSILPQISLKKEALRAISDSLHSDNAEKEDYIIRYILSSMIHLSDSLPFGFDILFTEKIKNGDERFYDATDVMPWKDWSEELTEAVNNFEAVEPTYEPFIDDIPF